MSSDSLNNPYTRYGRSTPKYFEKKKKSAKTSTIRPSAHSNTLRLNLNIIDEISILQSTNEEASEPLISHSCAWLETQIPMHCNSIRCPRIAPPICFGLLLVSASERHLEPESEWWVKNVDIYAPKKIVPKNKQRLFLHSLPNSYNVNSDLITIGSPHTVLAVWRRLAPSRYHNGFSRGIFMRPRSGELRTQKLQSRLMRTQSLKVLPIKSGVGQYIAMRATLTARDFFLANFYPSGPSTCKYFLC